MRQWFRMAAAADDPSVADIYIIDIIGDWIDEWMNEMFDEKITVTAKAFIDELAKLPAAVTTLRVHINSPGGDVWGAATIANALRDQQTAKGRTVETIIDGLAASAASVIAMAGSRVRMADNALFMIHNPWTWGAVGNAKELRQIADRLDVVRDTIVATYQWHTELEADEISALMDAETWMDADQALEKGFVTEKVEGLKAAASIDPRSLAKLTVPEKFRARVEALLAKPEPPPAPPTPAAAADVLRLCREGECLDLAEGLIQAGATVEQVREQVAAAKETKARARARETDIRSLCAAAKLPELADAYVVGGMAIAQVRAQLTRMTAKLDRVEIDGNLGPDQGARTKPVIDVSAVYAELNRLPQPKE